MNVCFLGTVSRIINSFHIHQETAVREQWLADLISLTQTEAKKLLAEDSQFINDL